MRMKMKRVFRRNQIIITTLAIMIAAAVAFLVVASMAFKLSGRYAELRAISTEMQMLSQRLSRGMNQAMLGNGHQRGVQHRGGSRRGLAAGEFFLMFQPQVDSDTGSPTGLEALLRWQHPSVGDVPPGLFIPLLEEARLITRLASWIYQQGAAQR